MNRRALIMAIYILTPVVIAVSLFIGPSVSVTMNSLSALFGHQPPTGEAGSIAATILFDVRLPRILLVFLTGGILAMCGCSLQAIFRNPLADPYVLGLSSGAAFGAAFALAIAPWMPVQVSAFIFGLVAVALSYSIARKQKTVSIVSLVLAGIVVNGIFTALLTIVQFLSDPFKLQTIVHWTMGNFHNAGWNAIAPSAFPALAGAAALLLMSWRMNALAMGDDEAWASGANPEREKIFVIIAATLAASSVVAVAGIIGLYGLVVPHLTRMISGVDNRSAMPLNGVLGGSFLVLVDDISRSLAGQEIPIGVFTLLIGAPVFIYLMRKTGTGWES